MWDVSWLRIVGGSASGVVSVAKLWGGSHLLSILAACCIQELAYSYFMHPYENVVR